MPLETLQVNTRPCHVDRCVDPGLKNRTDLTQPPPDGRQSYSSVPFCASKCSACSNVQIFCGRRQTRMSGPPRIFT